MPPTTLSLSCACQTITGTITIPLSNTPLPLEFCHCTKCRHSSGQLAISCFTCPRAPNNGPPTLQITSKQHPTAYKTSEELIRYFCHKCGASIYMHIVESGDFEVCSGVLGQVDGGIEGVVRFKQHIFVESTRDGGMSAWIEGPRWMGWAEKSEVFSVAKADEELSLEPRGGAETKGKRRLQGYCHCRGVEFYITPPDDETDSSSATENNESKSSQSQSQSQPQTADKWWLRASGTKYLAGLCACNSCRLATGYDLQAWAFVPKPHIRQLDGKEVDFTMGTLKTYSHSAGAYRDFCGRCGATVFWRHQERRGEIIDISAGLLDAEEGARAEEWLEWRTRVSFEECALNKGLVAKVAEGLKKWEER